MITCQQAKELISLQLDDMLTDDQQIQLTEHLLSCKSCQEYQMRMSTLDNDLKLIPEITLEESIVDNLIKNKQFVPLNKSKLIFRKLKPWHGVVAAAIIVGLIITPLSPFVEKNQEFSFDKAEMNQLQVADEEVAEDAVEPRGTAERQKSIGAESESGDMNNNIYYTEQPLVDAADAKEEDGLEQSKEAESVSLPYKIKEQDNRLIIYQEDKEIFKTAKWNENLEVKWEMVNEGEVTYSLYNSAGKLMEKYQININEKSEKKLDN